MAKTPKQTTAPTPAPEPEKPKVVIGEIVQPYRGSKLNDRTAAVICEFLIEGNYADTAAKAAGITYETFRQWMRKGEVATEGPYHEFHLAVTQAKAIGEAALVATIRDASNRGPQHWTAAAWILERTQPDKYGKSNRIELVTRERIRERADEEGLDPDEVAAMAVRLALEAGEEEEEDTSAER